MAITQTITALPTPPNPATDTSTDFSSKAQAFTVAQAAMGVELNTWATQVNALVAGLNAIAAGSAMAISYTFSTTTTDSDHDAGALRLNNATQNTATVVRADLLDAAGTDWSAALATVGDSTSTVKGYLQLSKLNDASKMLLFTVSALASPSGYKNITVACIAYTSASPFSNGDTVIMEFARTGDKGETGAAGTLSGTATGNINMADYQLSRAMLIDCGMTAVDKGNSGTSTQTLDYTAGSSQKVTATGNHTIASSNWPPTGNLGLILLELVNGGAYTITWPTISWVKPDGTTTTSISTYLAANTGRTALQTSGTDQVLLWSKDAGTTIYGKLV